MQTNNIRLDYRLEFESSFHCGTGLRQGLTHRSVARDTKAYLYIPGSTVKGILRDRATYLANLIGLTAPQPHNPETLHEFAPRGNIVSHIFGSRYRPGTLYFDDAQLCDEDRAFYEPETFRNQQVVTQTQVSMSRRTGAARRSMLFSSEYGVRGLRFDGQIAGALIGVPLLDDPAITYALVLLLAALSSLDQVGGNKSTGLGKVKCHITELTINSWMPDANGVEQEVKVEKRGNEAMTVVRQYLDLLPWFELYAEADEADADECEEE